MLVEFDTDQNNAVILARLATVLDPELDASIVELGFVHALRVHDRQAHVTLELPTSWCAMNFAFLMAEDVRKALLALDGIEAGNRSARRPLCGGGNRGRSERR